MAAEDSHLIMECEEEELEPWQQVDNHIQEEEVAVAMETKAVADSSPAVAAAPPADSLSAAPPAGPVAALTELVSMVMEVSNPNREGELATVVPGNTSAAPLAPPLVLREAVRPVLPPTTVPPLTTGPQLVLAQSPSPLPQMLYPLPVTPGVSPRNLAAQPIFITTQDTPQSQTALGGVLPSEVMGLVQKAATGQSPLNPVGFLLNGQAFTFLTAASPQLFKPAIAQALSQPTNQQPATTVANQQPLTMVSDQQLVTTTTEASQQPATVAANQQPVTMVANQKPATITTSQQPKTVLVNRKPVSGAASQQIPAMLTVKDSAPLTKIAAKPSSSKDATRISHFTLQKTVEKQPFKPDVKKLIKAVNEASTSSITQTVTPKVTKPTAKASPRKDPPTKVKVLLPRPVAGNKVCLQCGAQYRAVAALRGLLCLCSPEITQALQAIGAAGASNVGPAPSSTPALPKAPAPEASAWKPATPKVAATACVSVSPSCALSGPEEADADPQGKLIMLVDDFYYGRDEGRGVLDTWDASLQTPIKFRCLRCDKKLKSNIRLMNHLRHHEELEQQSGEVDTHSTCQHCYRRFPSPFRLQCHLETVHSQYESTTKCKICEWAFDSEPIFLQHMKNTHCAGEMPYVCQVCEFRSSVYSDVLNHFRNWHKDTASLLCPYCLKVFKTNSNYQHHYSRHQNKSVSHCDKCRLQFLSTRDKLEHKLSQHKSFRKPRQLEGMKPGTKVTIRAYAVENKFVGIVKTNLPQDTDVKSEPRDQPMSSLATPSPARKRPVGKRKPMCSMQEMLTKFQEERASLGKQSCLECTFDIPDFSCHFPTYVNCSLCHYCTCCSRAYANHMINNHVSRKTSTKYLALYNAGPRWSELVCTACSYTTQVGDQMARHLAKNPGHCSCYSTLRGPPVQRQRSQSHGDTAARAPLGPDGRQAVKLTPVSTSVYPLSHRDKDGKVDVNGRGAGPSQEGGAGRPAVPSLQLRVLLFALLCGAPRAAQRFRAPPQVIWTWLLERERGLEPGGGAKGEEAERLVQWVLNRREQQLPVHEKNLFGRASGLLRRHGNDGSQPALSHAWMVDFLLRWQLGVQVIGTASRPLPAPAERSARAFLDSTLRAAVALPPSAMGALDELPVFVNFDLLASATASRERKWLAFHLSGTGAPLCDVFLSAAADGTLLPALVFPQRPVPAQGLRIPHTILLGEWGPGAGAAPEQLAVWLSRVWERKCGAEDGAGAGAKAVLVMDSFRGHTRTDFQESLGRAGTVAAVIPLGCSGRLQPLEMCLGPALRGFLEARWSQFVEEGGADGKADPAKVLQLVVDWLGEALEGLRARPELLRRSFRCCGLVPAEPNDGDPAETQRELVRTLTEVLMGPQRAVFVPLEEKDEEGGAGGKGSALDTSAESSATSPRWPPLAANPQALRSIFEKDSDVESFLGFDESEISAVFGQ